MSASITTKRTSGRRSSRAVAKAAAAAAAGAALPAAKVSPRGARSQDELKAIAAAQAVVSELEIAVPDMRLRGELPHKVETTSLAHALRSHTREGWRIFVYHQGQKLVFNGDIRASMNGSLLFGFKPVPNSSHAFIDARGVSLVELAHTELETVIEGFRDWFVQHFGASPEDLLNQAKQSLSAQDLKNANDRKEDEEAPVALEQFIPSWGRWA
jgi:hypothetical protein